jgi:hypothetical protein
LLVGAGCLPLLHRFLERVGRGRNCHVESLLKTRFEHKAGDAVEAAKDKAEDAVEAAKDKAEDAKDKLDK